MAKTVQLGKNVDFYVGTILVGCAEEINIEMDVEQHSTKCQGSGVVNSYEPGNVDIKFSAKGVLKVYDNTEETTNFSVDDFFAATYAGTPVTIKYALREEGERIYEIGGYFKNTKITSGVSDRARYDISGWGNSWTLDEVEA